MKLKNIKIKELAFAALVVFQFTGCKKNIENSENSEKLENSEITEVTETKIPEDKSGVAGNYVSEDYKKRKEGYDWVAVSVSEMENEKLRIKVRSRADKKKPTCTFDAVIYKQNDSMYTTIISGKKILFRFNDKTLSIQPEKPEDDGVLAFYCSGGASVSGNYEKIEESLDSSQIDKTLFSKVLMLQGIGFNISSIEKNDQKTLTISPFGLEIDNSPITQEIEGEVVEAEAEDLNSDGSPELLVFTQSTDGNKRGNVYGFSVNNKKSMGMVYFEPVSENNKINDGYNGHDEFAVVETSLVQRFPIFSNGEKTGKTRQVSYKLAEGEAMRKFEIKDIHEY